jgi:hypothetical protein
MRMQSAGLHALHCGLHNSWLLSMRMRICLSTSLSEYSTTSQKISLAHLKKPDLSKLSASSLVDLSTPALAHCCAAAATARSLQVAAQHRQQATLEAQSTSIGSPRSKCCLSPPT